jgi:phosphatidylinositol alpha-1,6-mannosyltransferase
MRVLALVTDAFGGVGGIAQYNRDILNALARCAGDRRIVVLPRHGSAGRSGPPPGVRQLPPRRGKLAYALAASHAALTEGPFEAVFCGHLHMAPLGAAVARMLGVPLWLQLHGVEAWDGLACTQRWAARHAALITAVSRYTRRRFLRCADIDPSRVRVLPNTVDASFAPGPKPDYLLDRHRLRGRKVLLTVARLADDERRKGQDKVIEALPAMIATCPGLVYIVAGAGEDRARLEALARRSGVAHNVLFIGMVAPEELADHYRLADVFVMPSLQEGFGIVFLEAAACGIRPIGGNRDGSVDALADGAVGIAIDPANSAELVRAVADVLAGHGPDPAQVRRFTFESFAGLVCDLVSTHLPGPATRIA